MLPYRDRIHHLANSSVRRTRMRRFALVLLAGAASLVAAPLRPLPGQGFGVYEHNTSAMGRAGVTAARPCPDGSAIYFSPAGLAGLSGTHIGVGVTLIGAQGNFTDDFLAGKSDLKNPLIPVPNIYITHAINPKLTAGIGLYAPYGLETKWDANSFPGRFLGYNTVIRSIYVQPTIGYQVSPTLQFGIGVAYIHSTLKLRQRADLSTQLVPDALRIPAGLPVGITFAGLCLQGQRCVVVHGQLPVHRVGLVQRRQHQFRESRNTGPGVASVQQGHARLPVRDRVPVQLETAAARRLLVSHRRLTGAIRDA